MKQTKSVIVIIVKTDRNAPHHAKEVLVAGVIPFLDHFLVLVSAPNAQQFLRAFLHSCFVVKSAVNKETCMLWQISQLETDNSERLYVFCVFLIWDARPGNK